MHLIQANRKLHQDFLYLYSIEIVLGAAAYEKVEKGDNLSSSTHIIMFSKWKYRS